jgi:hypothetical protein
MRLPGPVTFPVRVSCERLPALQHDLSVQRGARVHARASWGLVSKTDGTIAAEAHAIDDKAAGSGKGKGVRAVVIHLISAAAVHGDGGHVVQLRAVHAQAAVVDGDGAVEGAAGGAEA